MPSPDQDKPNMRPDIERRFIACPLFREVRAGPDGEKTSLIGYASVFYDGTPATEYRIFDDLIERVAPEAFDRMLADANWDIAGLFNHDANMLLARRSAGTLRLSKDSRGLQYILDLGPTSISRDVAAFVERREIVGSSFSFTADSVRGQRWEENGETSIRTLTDLDVFDVGPVTFPAYEGTTATTAAAASRRAREQCDAFRRQVAKERDAQRVARFLETHKQE